MTHAAELTRRINELLARAHRAAGQPRAAEYLDEAAWLTRRRDALLAQALAGV